MNESTLAQLLSLLGIARRAGRIAAGFDAATGALIGRKAHAVFFNDGLRPAHRPQRAAHRRRIRRRRAAAAVYAGTAGPRNRLPADRRAGADRPGFSEKSPRAGSPAATDGA